MAINTKNTFKELFPTVIPAESYELYNQWRKIRFSSKHYLSRRRLEKELRKRGLGYLVGDLPKKKVVGERNLALILDYRKKREQGLHEEALAVRRQLRKAGLGAFAGDYVSAAKPSLLSRVFSQENIESYTAALTAPIIGCLDAEFTTYTHEMLSLGCSLYDTQSGQCFDFYETIHPLHEQKLSKRCLSITHLSQEEIDHSDDFPTVMRRFLDFLNRHQATYLITWGSSDSESVRVSFSRSHMGLKERDAFLKRIVDIQPPISLMRDQKRSQFSLADMKDYYHLEGEVAHHALSDARDLKDIVLAFKESHPVLSV